MGFIENIARVRSGLFKNPIDAAKKYDEMTIKYHGEFARINFQGNEVSIYG